MDDKDNALVQAAEGTGQKRSRWAWFSFISANVAIGGLFLAQLVPLFIVLYLAFPGAIVFGHLGKREVRKEPERYTGMVMAQYGLFVGYFCLFITGLVISMANGFQVGGK